MTDAQPDLEFSVDDFVAALTDIAEVAPELIESILTCYPPELMLRHMSPELCQLLEQQRRLLYPQGKEDSSSFLSNS